MVSAAPCYLWFGMVGTRKSKVLCAGIARCFAFHFGVCLRMNGARRFHTLENR